MKSLLLPFLFAQSLQATYAQAQVALSVKEINPVANSEQYGFTASGNNSGFIANDAAHRKEPWICDGNKAGTFMINDVDPAISKSTLSESGTLFPDRFSGQVSIKNQSKKDQRLTISDMSGKIIIETVKSGNQNQFDVAVNGLEAGTYILRTGNYSWKFIKN